MPVTVVTGGQFGSEGKGKVVQCLSRIQHPSIVVRVGGPGSGHTGQNRKGETQVLRMLSMGALDPERSTVCVLPPGAYIDPVVLLYEIVQLGLPPERLMIDPNASVIHGDDLQFEHTASMNRRIGSTETGTGAALIRRIERCFGFTMARDCKELQPYLGDTSHLLRKHLGWGKRVIVEGTQGFGLDLLHTPHYPYCTARGTTAAAFVAEAGLSPMDVDEVVMVIRTFPIRVAGNSGPLENETSWDEVTQSAGGTPTMEYSSVTHKLRRVGRFDPMIVRKAIARNNPTMIVLNHLDYIEVERQEAFVRWVEESIDRQIHYVGRSPRTIERRAP